MVGGGLIDQGPQVRGAIGELQVAKRTTHVSGAEPEERTCPLVERRDGPRGIDEELRDRAGFEADLRQAHMPGPLAIGRMVSARGGPGGITPRHLPRNPAL